MAMKQFLEIEVIQAPRFNAPMRMAAAVERKVASVSRHSVTRCLHKRSSRRAGASENLPRRRQNLVRQRGILDRTGERQCADNSGEGGDGATTPDGGGAPK